MVLQINSFKPMQTPAMLRGKRSFISCIPPAISEPEKASSDSQKQCVFEKMLPPPSSNIEGPVLQHVVNFKDASFKKSDSSLYPRPSMKVSDDHLSGIQFYQEKNLILESTTSEKDTQSDPEESNQIVQDNDTKTGICNQDKDNDTKTGTCNPDKENDTKFGICNRQDDKNSRTPTKGLLSTKLITHNNVITKPSRATAGNAFQNA